MKGAPTTAATLAVALASLAACGGADSGSGEKAAACSPVDEVPIGRFADHEERAFEADDYATNPPAGGDHNPEALAPGSHSEPVRLGEAVHLLEHGAVVAWTNGLPEEDAAALAAAFTDLRRQGYFQLATVENPEMKVPFALSAWGAVQMCEAVDAPAFAAFVEEWYASPKAGEGSLACHGRAATLPPCRTDEVESRPA